MDGCGEAACGGRREGRRRAIPAAARAVLREAGSPGRDALEAYVARRYGEAYGARVTAFLPTLLGIEDERGDVLGAIGAREAALPGPLFLETYLDAPVERALEDAGLRVPRGSLAEVGNLCGSVPGCGPVLVSALAAYLDAIGVTHAVFTATAALRNAFDHMGAAVTEVARADGARLGGSLADWGTYYGTDPRVVAVPVLGVLDAVRARPRLAERVAPLWEGARAAGDACARRRAATPAGSAP